ncbi:DUF5753 domain-containing protein [Nocardia arthritidis]|uniref:DUF5753 domain-containing protein n=1 Tax=Nocardia arthritidis TaxID=228602 RepID=UPI00142D3202|nr:DUF5753 domain-containing protein [Nocardia arthritidis]
MATSRSGLEGRLELIGRRQKPGRSTVLPLFLGARLRRLREARGITQQQAGAAIFASDSKVSRLEAGLIRFQEKDVRNLLTLYRVAPSELSAYLAWVPQVNGSGCCHFDDETLGSGFGTLLDLEPVETLRRYEQGLVPELLQTDEYARAALRLAEPVLPDAEFEPMLAARLAHRIIITRVDPPRVWLIVEDAALRRRVGGNTVWRKQIEQLRELASLPHVVLQIVPDTACGPAFVTGSFTYFRFRENSMPDVVRLHEMAGSRYLADQSDTERFLIVADRLSTMAHTPPKSLLRLGELLREP